MNRAFRLLLHIMTAGNSAKRGSNISFSQEEDGLMASSREGLCLRSHQLGVTGKGQQTLLIDKTVIGNCSVRLMTPPTLFSQKCFTMFYGVKARDSITAYPTDVSSQCVLLSLRTQ